MPGPTTLNVPNPSVSPLSLSQMSSGWPEIPNRVILFPDVGCFQKVVVGVPRVFPILGVTRSRELGPASADHCPAALAAEEAELQRPQPGDLRRSFSTIPGYSAYLGYRWAGDDHSLAPCRVQSVLALAVKTSAGKIEGGV